MVRHSLKILQHLPPDFSSVPDYFMALRSKGLKKKINPGNAAPGTL